MALTNYIKKYAKEIKIELSPEKISDIDIYIREINAWSKKADLTSIKGDENILVNLFIDAFTSCLILKTEKSLLI